jgi:integrase/recombinase XerD
MIYSKVKVVKQLAEYLLDQGIKTYVPQLPKYRRGTFIPYIYSYEEINAIFRACDSLRMKCKSVASCIFIMPCLLRLLYGTGIRISFLPFSKFPPVNNLAEIDNTSSFSYFYMRWS